ncbi:hypothetical protein HDK77DRAFT_176850 [Phyllosticta capitalensis]|uniref:Zn(2)-C6 fungal-type domain-containing protein n=1 Tax=Phyllosticta capitalensis TaxID=121624 RepID=A0ABR1YVL4_9PEZI
MEKKAVPRKASSGKAARGTSNPTKEAPNSAAPPAPSNNFPTQVAHFGPSKVLVDAICRADHWRLQKALINISRESAIGNALVERQLLAIDMASGEESAVASLLGVKRKIPRFVMCRRCREEFDVCENIDGACKYHPRPLACDESSDVWWGWHEHVDPEAILDDDRTIENHPKGFEWCCCYKPADAEGCQTGRHEEAKDFRQEVKNHKWDPYV